MVKAVATARSIAARALLAPALALALGGCLLTPDRPAVNLEIPENYRNGPQRPAETAPAVAQWWRGFGSKELNTLIEDANVYNIDIAIASAQIVQAEAQAGIAAAPLFPQLTGTANAQRSRTPASSTTGAVTRSQYNVGLTASYMIDFWGKNRSALLAAEENADLARFNREVVTISTVSAVVNSYFAILSAQDQLRVARNNLAAAERILSLIRRQFTAGTTSQLDVSQQEALVANQRASIPPLEIIVRQNIATLAVLVARPPANISVAGGSMRQLAVPRIRPGLPSQLLYQRPDVRLAEAQLASSNYSVDSARAALFPQIQLTASTGYQSAALASLFVPGAWYYTLAAGLTQPIFDGFLLRNQLAQARGVQMQYLETYRKAVLSSFADVDKALVAVQQYTLQERLQQAAVAASRRAFDVAETQLNGGTVNLITVLQTQLTLFQAENTLVQVRLQKLLATSSLFQALGGGWSPDNVFIDGLPPQPRQGRVN
ncbi:outer membrane protein OprM precursor [Variibacter gotjawalensis]|uniref:Outer membrane protein OprM n=1 Tax=Variibacter gotjawalensis TaxID=1333996 RepID=A0A0S3Q186_9BRAD|nr:efflux transporter outer membrane subunit [Variibacter gotjawalensis]NIK47765.1 NodT family efflux transporter outer membrane factor (OMF) lipoprotein [Variibacter gotjawalensis]RZS49652.1 NodT family efflux transporter outer membrane factor (OMF) lipoprotein [Variibacter gotjawalensis]BAT61918.1 outer membrane protein OprM precursor [Variibacter gotjawalensis]